MATEFIPLVSCVCPTFDRPAFLALAVEKFLAQDWRNKELVVIKSGPAPVPESVRKAPGVRLVELKGGPYKTGTKRDMGLAAAAGKYICHWDDDDWFGPARIRLQVEALLLGRADITALPCEYVLQLPAGVFRVPARVRLTAMDGGVNDATLCYPRELWKQSEGFPDKALGADNCWFRNRVAEGARVEPVENRGLFVYVRHRRSTLPYDSYLQPGHVPRPAFFPAADLDRWRAAAREVSA